MTNIFTFKRAERRQADAASTPLLGTPQALSARGLYPQVIRVMEARISDLKRWNFVLGCLAGVAVGGLALSGPLKERVPYFYEVNSATGSVALSNKVIEELNVTDDNIMYFLRVWAARMITINRATLKEGQPAAYSWTRGSAQTEFDLWSEKTDRTAERIAQDPSLTREILGIPNVAFNADKTIAFLDFTFIEKSGGVERTRRRLLLSVEFALAPSKKADKRDPDNPIGLVITHITVGDQVSK